MKADITHEIDTVISDLTKAIYSFNANEFNTIPFQGSWTPAQVTEHLTLGVDPAILYGNVKQVSRDPGEKIESVKAVFLDFSIRMQSPDFVLPSNNPHTREEMAAKLTQIWERMKEATHELDLTLTCTDFEIPGFGEFTRLEWIWFYIFHTKRHIHQLHKIARRLHGKEVV